jgi:hypothetical protein
VFAICGFFTENNTFEVLFFCLSQCFQGFISLFWINIAVIVNIRSLHCEYRCFPTQLKQLEIEPCFVGLYGSCGCSSWESGIAVVLM